MKLLLDIGNSRVKRAWLDRGKLQPMTAAPHDPVDFNGWCRRHLAADTSPQAVWVANVAGAEVAQALTAWCLEQWQLEPVFAATERTAGGVHNAYDNVSEMGVDRWLAMVAARQLYPQPLCIVSCGTALTLDALDAAGQHLGGLILPSPALMQLALNRATHGVRTTGELTAELKLGRSTRAGVAAGSSYATVGLIERVFEQLTHDHADRDRWRCLITGGAAAGIMSLCRVPLEPVPDLVLRGLAFYAGQSS